MNTIIGWGAGDPPVVSGAGVQGIDAESADATNATDMGTPGYSRVLRTFQFAMTAAAITAGKTVTVTHEVRRDGTVETMPQITLTPASPSASIDLVIEAGVTDRRDYLKAYDSAAPTVEAGTLAANVYLEGDYSIGIWWWDDYTPPPPSVAWGTKNPRGLPRSAPFTQGAVGTVGPVLLSASPLTYGLTDTNIGYGPPVVVVITFAPADASPTINVGTKYLTNSPTEFDLVAAHGAGAYTLTSSRGYDELPVKLVCTVTVDADASRFGTLTWHEQGDGYLPPAKIKGVVRDESGKALSGVTVRAHRRDTGAVLGEAVSGTAPGEANVALRISFDGGSATDTSKNSIPLTAAGGAVIVEGTPAGWGKVLDCTDAAGNANITTTFSDALRITGEFCLECRVMVTSYGGDGTRFIAANAGAYAWDTTVSIRADGSGRFDVVALGVAFYTPGLAFPLNTWTHIAVTRDATGLVRGFVDGVFLGGGDPGTHTTTRTMVASPHWCFGADPTVNGPGAGGRCLLDDITLTIGHSVYDPAGFVPPKHGSVPGLATYEIATDYRDEAYVVGIAPAGLEDPSRNHSVIRVVPG